MSHRATIDRHREPDSPSRPKEWVVAVLYEQLLASLRRAATQLDAHDLEGKAASIEQANAILFDLLGALDLAKGGEIAARLAALYRYFINELMAVSRTLDREHLDRVTAMVAELHGVWVQAAEQVHARAIAS